MLERLVARQTEEKFAALLDWTVFLTGLALLASAFAAAAAAAI